MTIFTDGSKTKERLAVGAAWLCPSLAKAEYISLNKFASVFTTESSRVYVRTPWQILPHMYRLSERFTIL
ncbi:hypothetical protein WN55_08555 [Dufourea novaeangliae]|uniref:Uncharacterized protein n=1 Tax=Dufourea novaeangliae TaxID=178035 RepID=A0A154P5P4_DUFNO|nr:hypothetical protein WN55_08555 [Dufourea novaeangliae]